MSARTITAILTALAVALVVVTLVASSDDDDDTDAAASVTSGDTTEPFAEDPTITTETDPDEPDAPCGVTLAEVQALLPPDSGVTENATPDPGRCNFTWDDGGPRGLDVAIVTDGRDAFDLPAGYEALEGYGDMAYESVAPGRASAFAFVDDDLYAADVVADGTGATDAELRALCLELLNLTLD